MSQNLIPLHLIQVSSLTQKFSVLESTVHEALLKPNPERIPLEPARDIQVLHAKLHAPKVGISQREGQGRLLHDLASIELQATELAIRTLEEFPKAPQEFREQLAEIALNEGEHLQLCVRALNDLGFEWGHWPVHIGLWAATNVSDSLLDRLLIVHRFLEGAGLDAGEAILKKLSGVNSPRVRDVVKKIREEELGHVQFGSRWYQNLCRLENLDPDLDFEERLERIWSRLPPRREPILKELRLEAGFTPHEILILERIQKRPKVL